MRPVAPSTLLLLLAATAGAGDRPVISFEKNQVIVDSITQGGRVACYGVAHDFLDLDRAIYRWGREAVDTDGNGSVAIELPREVPERSIWVCADVATGRLSVQAPDGSSGVEVPLRGRGALLSAANNDRFEVASDRVDLLLGRPGEGAWLQLTGDGGASDHDLVTDGAVNARAAEFEGIGALKAVPATLRGAGTIVAFYPYTLEYSVVTLGKAE